MRLRAVFTAILLLAGTFAAQDIAAAAPGAYIYWADFGGQAVGRANVDGSAVSWSFIKPGPGVYPRGVTKDSRHIYFSSYGIMRADLDGSNLDLDYIGIPINPTGLAVDSSSIYWADGGLRSVGRANLDGTGVDPVFIGTSGVTSGVALDSGHIYWTASGAIGRASLHGTDRIQQFISGVSDAQGLAVDENYIYWAGSNYIGRANLDGSGMDPSFIQGVVSPASVAVNNRFVYWTSRGSSSEGGRSIGRAKLDGSGAIRRFIGVTLGQPGGIAVDNAAPLVSGFTPSSGITIGGTTVVITGTGFLPGANAIIGGAPCSSPVVLDSQTMQCVTPPHPMGSAYVWVVNPDQQIGGAAANFSYVATDQQPRRGCARVPDRLRLRTQVTVLKAHCRTTSGVPVQLEVAARNHAGASRGLVRIFRRSNGSIELAVRRPRTTVWIAWSAPSVGTFLPLRWVERYRV